MKTGSHQDRIAILRAEGDVTSKIGRVETLECKAFFRAVDAVIVDFVEIDFGRGIVDVVFVGGKAGPVAAGSVDLDDDEFVGGEVRADDVQLSPPQTRRPQSPCRSRSRRNLLLPHQPPRKKALHSSVSTLPILLVTSPSARRMAMRSWCDPVFIPSSAGPGYDVYYLNFLAGTSRTLAVTEDPNHVWLKSTWKDTDPRLPLVR